MPTLQLAGSRTFHVADTLLEQPADHVRRYHVALAPETSQQEAVEQRLQRQGSPTATDTLGKLAQQAQQAAFSASPQARALLLLVDQVEQKPVGDLSDQGLRDRLSYLLACGLTEALVQEQHARVEAELRSLLVPYLVTCPEEGRELEAARTAQRRVLALCDYVLGIEAPVLTTRSQVAHALLDLLEPATIVGDASNIHPQVRQRSFDSLCLLLLQEQRAGRIKLLRTPWQKKRNPYLLPLGLFLEHLRAISTRLPN
jgi:hypothetical protein